MSTCIFPKHDDADLYSFRRRAYDKFVEELTKAPPTYYGRLDFAYQLSDTDSAVANVEPYARRVAGRLKRNILFLAVGERGSVLGRPHCHGLFWVAEPDKQVLRVMDDTWVAGGTELSRYIPTDGRAVRYMAWKLARGESWDCTRRLFERLGSFRKFNGAA